MRIDVDLIDVRGSAVKIDLSTGNFSQRELDGIDASGVGVGIVAEIVRRRSIGNRDVDAVDTLDIDEGESAAGLVGLDQRYAADVGHVERGAMMSKRFDLDDFDVGSGKTRIQTVVAADRKVQRIFLAAAAVKDVTQLQGVLRRQESVITLATVENVLIRSSERRSAAGCRR